MSNQLSIQINIQNDTAMITLDGIINEDSSFEKIKNLNIKKYIKCFFCSIILSLFNSIIN